MEDIKLIQILWDYMKMHHKLEHSDCIIGLGTMDINVANIASELYLNGYANKLIFSGGLGKITYKLWNETEAEKFARIAIDKGVPRQNIYLEKESTNTGDNFRFSKSLIENEKLNIKSCIVVCKPYDEKRTYAAFKKIMPEYEVIIYSENISCQEYYKRNGNEWINVLVGDIQRMKLFFEKGWQIEMDIPKEVWDAYETLVKRGYDKFVLKDQKDEGDKKNIEIKLNKVL
ncbi:MAG: YdcF family protein [Clostridia bacterium]